MEYCGTTGDGIQKNPGSEPAIFERFPAKLGHGTRTTNLHLHDSKSICGSGRPRGPGRLSRGPGACQTPKSIISESRGRVLFYYFLRLLSTNHAAENSRLSGHAAILWLPNLHNERRVPQQQRWECGGGWFRGRKRKHHHPRRRALVMCLGFRALRLTHNEPSYA